MDLQVDEARHAFEDVDGRCMTYGGFRSHTREMIGRLNAAGYGRAERISTVFSVGSEQLIALTALTAGFAVVPVNPAVGEEEYERFFSEAKVKAMIIDSKGDCPARRVAARLGIDVFELVKEGDERTLGFRIEGPRLAGWVEPEYSQEGDTALILGTSGTTSKPKLVPYIQWKYCWSIEAVRSLMDSNENDRYLVFMPLFHGHGIVPPARVLLAKGCVVMAPAFDPEKFYGWLDSARINCITAGPTNYQAILEYSKKNMEIISRIRMRRISTGNAAMPVPVMEELERLFRAPVIEAYGMSEFVVISCNPMPPGKVKHGSAGIPYGNEVAVIDEGGETLPQGKIGEIAVRGIGMEGYENDPEANARAYINGWFRTGDVGYFDEDGYLFIKGRVKELINRGGEKIAPREVEDVLLQHPAVKETVVFSVPHPKLGEDVAAAVVLREGQEASETQLRVHVSGRLAFFKVPSRVLVLEALPKGATGKLTRIGMAEVLGLGTAAKGAAEYVPPRTDYETRLVKLLEGVFGVERVGVKDNFFDLGGHSVMAVKLFSEIEKEFGVKLPLSTLFQYPTVEGLAEMLGEGQKQKAWEQVVPLQPMGRDPPLFLIHGGDGDVINYTDLVKELGAVRKIYGIQARGLDGREEPMDDLEEIVGLYISKIRAVQPKGPYYLAGFSAGGIISFELARRLKDAGDSVPFVGIIDIDAPKKDSRFWRRNARRTFLREALFLWNDMKPGSRRRKAGLESKFWPRVKMLAKVGAVGVGLSSMSPGELLPGDAVILPTPRRRVYSSQMRALVEYEPKEYTGSVVVFRGKGIPFIYPSVEESGWEEFAKGGVKLFVVPGRIHGRQLREPNVKVLAARMNETMASVAESA